MQKLLLELDACKEARAWAGDKTLEEAWSTCERGDWMLWLAQRAGVEMRTLTRAKARCAELALPYMQDDRSRKAILIAFAYADGDATEDELRAAAYAAYAAYTAADGDAAAYAAYAAYAAADAAAAAEDAAYADTLRECAVLVRETIPYNVIARYIL